MDIENFDLDAADLDAAVEKTGVSEDDLFRALIPDEFHGACTTKCVRDGCGNVAITDNEATLRLAGWVPAALVNAGAPVPWLCRSCSQGQKASFKASDSLPAYTTAGELIALLNGIVEEHGEETEVVISLIGKTGRWPMCLRLERLSGEPARFAVRIFRDDLKSLPPFSKDYRKARLEDRVLALEKKVQSLVLGRK